MENGKEVALVKSSPARVSSANTYEPRGAAEAFQMAAWFAKSGFLGDVNTAEKAFLIMATGADLGIPATTALRCVSIVKGKPVLSADLMKAMCLSRPEVCEKFEQVATDEKKATYRAKRVGSPVVEMSFTMEDADRAKLKDRGADKGEAMYAKYPALMLRHRCVAMIAREVFPDICLGVYCEEEADEMRGTSAPTARDVVDVESVDTGAAADLAERIEGFKAAIAAAASLSDLAAVRAAVDRDPGREAIKGAIGKLHDAQKKDLINADADKSDVA